MRFRITNLLPMYLRNHSRLKPSYLVMFGVVLGMAGFLLVFLFSNIAYAAGGVGSGGSGGGSGGGHQTYYGWGWVEYPASGPGPTDGFRDGSAWADAQAACLSAGAASVYAHIILDISGEGMIYDYKTIQTTPDVYDGNFGDNWSVDNGRAISTTTDLARLAFDSLAISYNVNTSGYAFGDNVGWFCYNFAPATIQGRIWRDENADGVWNNGESLIQNGVNCGAYSTVDVSVTAVDIGSSKPQYCNPEPHYSIGNIRFFGWREVRSNPPVGWVATTGPQWVNAQPGGVYDVWFGIRPTAMPLSCIVSIPNGDVVPGASYTVRFTVTNPAGNVPLVRAGGWRLGANGNGWLPFHTNYMAKGWGYVRADWPGGTINAGTTKVFDITFQAKDPLGPATAVNEHTGAGPYGVNLLVGNYLFQWQVVQEGNAWFGQICSTWLYVRTPPPVCHPPSQTVGVGEPASFSATVGNLAYSWSTNPVGSPSTKLAAPFPAGASFTTRWDTIGSKTVTVTSGGQTANCNITVVTKPFFIVRGGDVTAGITTSAPGCSGWGVGSSSAASLSSWNQSATPNIGAGTNLATFARGNIIEFASAQLRTSPSPPKDLSFANALGTGLYGGSFGGGIPCPTDYAATRLTTTTMAIFSPVIVPDDNNAYYMATGNLVISSGSVTGGNRPIIYVDGNVYITGNITLSSGATLASLSSFYLVVKGNIYIAPGVTRLDGVYVAQPNGATGGKIYTCTNSTGNGPPTQSDLNNACKNTVLTVNGAFIAKELKLYRSTGTLSANTPAEIFNYTPATWLAAPDSIKDNYGGYDAITSLPPVL